MHEICETNQLALIEFVLLLYHSISINFLNWSIKLFMPTLSIHSTTSIISTHCFQKKVLLMELHVMSMNSLVWSHLNNIFAGQNEIFNLWIYLMLSRVWFGIKYLLSIQLNVNNFFKKWLTRQWYWFFHYSKIHFRK